MNTPPTANRSGRGVSLRVPLARVVAALCMVLLAACNTMPTHFDKQYSKALAPAGDSRLERIVHASSPAPTQTGFRLLPLGLYALDARIELATRAQRSIDLQYYLIANDGSGRLLMRSLRDAAARGVRVRLLVDDLYTAGSDPLFQGLAAFPNAEVRLFNPFCCARQSVASKFIASLGDFQHLNHRMHNKLFIADGAVAIMGGRNVADEYFSRSETTRFVDMDILVVGSVLPKLSSIFDAYWNSPQAYPIASILGGSTDLAAAQTKFNQMVEGGEQMVMFNLPPHDMLGNPPIGQDLDAGTLELAWGTAVAFADPPNKVMATSAAMARSMSVQMDIMDRVMKSRRDVTISSPYFIPGAVGIRQFDELIKRHVKVAILTNSLAATDVPLVHTGYARYRAALLRSGVSLYELSPTRADRDTTVALPGSSLGRLHAKTAVIDQSMVYIGSMNLDPRSDSTNTELGLLAECPLLARQVLRVIEVSKQRGSYRLQFAADGESLEWLADDGSGEVVHTQEPEVTPFMRFQNMLLGPFVPEQLL